MHFGECWWSESYRGCLGTEYELAGSILTTRFWEVKQQDEDFPEGTFCHPHEDNLRCSSIYTSPLESVSYQLDMCSEISERRWGGKFVKYTALPLSYKHNFYSDASCMANRVEIPSWEVAMYYCWKENWEHKPRSWKAVCGPQNTTIDYLEFDNGNCSGRHNDWCVMNEDGSTNGSWCSWSIQMGCYWNMSIADNPCWEVASSFQAAGCRTERVP